MIQLVFLGIILYVILYLLAKAQINSGLTRVLSVVNTVIIVVFGIVFLVKTGLLRVVAGFISFLLIRLTDFLGAMF